MLRGEDGYDPLDRCVGCGQNDVLAFCGRGERVGFGPKLVRHFQSVDAGVLPPFGFVTDTVDFAMVSAAEWYGKLVADLEAETAYLRKAQMMGVAG